MSSANMDLENNQVASEDRVKHFWISWIPIKTRNYFKISIQVFSIFKDFAFFFNAKRSVQRAVIIIAPLHCCWQDRIGITSFQSILAWENMKRRPGPMTSPTSRFYSCEVNESLSCIHLYCMLMSQDTRAIMKWFMLQPLLDSSYRDSGKCWVSSYLQNLVWLSWLPWGKAYTNLKLSWKKKSILSQETLLFSFFFFCFVFRKPSLKKTQALKEISIK